MHYHLTLAVELDNPDELDNLVEGIADYAEALIVKVEQVENWEFIDSENES